MDQARTTHWHTLLRASLDDCVQFWLSHSLDPVHGGYFNCLDR